MRSAGEPAQGPADVEMDVSEREPIFNVPASVIGVLLILVGMHYGLNFVSEETKDWLTAVLAFIPARYGHNLLLPNIPGGWIASVTSFVTHMLLHVDTPHLLINGFSLLAFGGAVAKRIGHVRFLLFLGVTGIAGALAYLALNWGKAAIVVGASGAVSGLMAGAFRFFFAALETVGLQGLRDNPSAVPLMSIAGMFRNRPSLIAIVVWMVANFLMGLGGSIITDGGGIAWEAHLGGFGAGLLLFGWFDRAASKQGADQTHVTTS